MRVNDVVYGEMVFPESVFTQLVSCPEVKRALHIYQNGLPPEWDDQPVFSRLEHSLGVAILLRKVGASLAEQVAGLGHDVSHTAFSHTIDMVIGDPTKEDYQDNTHKEYVARSEIPGILLRNGLPKDTIDEAKKFGLLERDAPNLCADRVDYALRDWAYVNGASEARQVASDIINHDGQLAFQSEEGAYRFWQMYSTLNEKRWAGRDNLARHYLVAQSFKNALHEGAATMKDIYKPDDEVVKIMRTAKNRDTRFAIHCLDHGFTLEDGDFIMPSKFRYINPEFVEAGELKKLSQVLPGYAHWLEQARAKHQAMRPVSFIAKKPF